MEREECCPDRPADRQEKGRIPQPKEVGALFQRAVPCRDEFAVLVVKPTTACPAGQSSVFRLELIVLRSLHSALSPGWLLSFIRKHPASAVSLR